MIVDSLKEIPILKKVAVIVNVGTKYVTSLALLSWLKHSNLPVVVIDCESKDGSYEYFTELNKTHTFYLTKLPLKKHGYTIDHIFNELKADYIYLVDSDTEVVNADIFTFIDSYIERDNVFGVGYIHEGGWLEQESLLRGLKFGYFHERMWIPFTCLNVEKVRMALSKGYSFINVNKLNDFYPSQLLSKLLIARQLIPGMKHTRLSLLNIFKKSINGQKPSYIVYDTGALIYHYLKYDKGYDFVGIPAKYHGDSVLHYHGVTRKMLDPSDSNAHSLTDYEHILGKLRTNYAVEVED
jgi:hypothetical protein